VEKLIRLVGASTEAFSATLRAALGRLNGVKPEPVGSHFSWD
jgi:hypothetical protein